MSSTHTPGKLRAVAMGGSSTVLAEQKPRRNDTRIPAFGYDEKAGHCIAYPFFEDYADGEKARYDFVCFSHDDARRLAACWNALEGFATEDIEAGAIERLSSAALLADCGPSRLQQLVDALAKTETYLQERLAATNGTGATKILPMIRAAIEGAGVTPTPTSWGDFPGSEATHG